MKPHKSKKNVFLGFLIAMLVIPINTVYAVEQLLFANDYYDIAISDVVFDSKNAGGNINLQFGDTLNEQLQWDNSSFAFVFTDDLELDGNNFIFDRDNTGAGADVNIVANQGSDNDGALRYNSTTNQWEVSNDGGAFTPMLEPASDMSAARYRDSSTTDINSSATDNLMPWDTEDFEDSLFVHDTAINNSRIQVTEDGRYLVSGGIAVINTSTFNFRYNGRVKFRVNGSTVLPMRFQPGYIRQTSGQEETSLVYSAIVELAAGDYFEILVDRENTTTGPANLISGQSSLSIVQLKGKKGDKGDQGDPGADGADGSVGLGTDESTFTIDQDDTGGDVELIFGTTLAEKLFWDSVNSEFNLTDDVSINGDLKVSGDIGSACGASAAFSFERGTIASNQSWALGNGQTPYGTVMGCDGTVQKMAATCTGTIGTSLSAVLRKNNVATACTVNISTTTGQATIVDCNEPFVGTDVLGIYAGTENGTWTECVGTFWAKYDDLP